MNLRQIKVFILAAVSFSLIHTVRAATIGVSAPAYGPSTLYSGLIGWWTFDGKNMTTNVAESSGVGDVGSWQGGATTTMQGAIGQAASFNGATYVQLPNDSKYNFSSASNFTLNAWVNEKVLAVKPLFSTMDGTGNGGLVWDIAGNGLSMIVRDTITSSTVSKPGPMVANKWYMVTAVFTGPASINFYVNGVSIGSGTFTVNMAAVGSPRYIAHESNVGSFFTGGIDDMRVYNRALSQAEIQQLYGQGTSDQGVSNTPIGSLKSGLVGWWTFDGKNMVPNVRDSSAQGNNGNLTGATSTVQGKLGQALSFNGTSNVVTATMSSSLQIATPSISAWVKFNSFATNCDIVQGGATNHGYYLEVTSAGNLAFGGQFGAGSISASPGIPSLGVWYHIVATFDGTTANIYRNGVNIKSSALTTTINGAGNLTIGDGADGFCNATIDDVHIYNRALSASEVQQLYNQSTSLGVSNTLAGSLKSGLVGWWTFDGNKTLQTITDSSGNGFNGSVSGGTTTDQGKIGQALKFNGSTNFVNIPDISSKLNLVSATPPSFSISAWFRPLNPSTDLSGITIVSGGGRLVIRSATNKFLFQLVNGSTQNQSLSACSAGTWCHVVGTYDSPSKVMSIYFNGSFESSTTAAVTDLSASTQATTIGKAPGIFNGTVDDVRIYSKVLTPAEVKQLYTAAR